MVFEDISLGEQVLLSTETGPDGTLTDKTACLTDDTNATSCVEVKAGQGIRAVWPHAPGAMSSSTLRIGVNAIMQSGPLRIAPYDTTTTIDNTNGKTTQSIGGGGDFDESLSNALIGDCLLAEFTFRLFENGEGSKIKTAELDIESTILTIAITGVTKDDDDVIDDLMPLVLWRRTGGSAPYDWIQVDKLTSAVTTGAYTFNYEDDGSQYRVMGQNTDGTESDITPEVQGV